MRRSGDLVIGRSGDLESELTAEARRHGEGSGDRVIARDRVIGKPVNILRNLVIGQPANSCHPERDGADATASRRNPTTPVAEHAASGSSYEAFLLLRRLCQNAWTVLLAVLREIFDESAYDRFLLRTDASRSIASYREFTRERDAAMQKKPRCC
ncbi:MAG TPA: hypothetical protein VGJ51_14225 [Candidatus Angelobacter sp.]